MKTWVIVCYGYGSFFLKGTEEEAEEYRKKKANWELSVTRKRLADKIEIKTGKINECKNHPNFNAKTKYSCKCDSCIGIKKKLIEKI